MQFRFQPCAVAMLPAAAMPEPAAAQEKPFAQEELDIVLVWNRTSELTGKAQVASEGAVGYADFETRPILRARSEIKLNILNVFDSDDCYIAYFYQSQLRGEPIGVEDLHFHPVETRQICISFGTRF